MATKKTKKARKTSSPNGELIKVKKEKFVKLTENQARELHERSRRLSFLEEPCSVFNGDTGLRAGLPYIASNQVKCGNCGDEIFSGYRHDYVTCSCGETSVDGGQDYMKRSTKKENGYLEKSIVIKRYQIKALCDAIHWSFCNNRNQLGMALAVLRACRDTGLLKGF